jgi:SPP1 gp7 family putative phage head morphogenesis protein
MKYSKVQIEALIAKVYMGSYSNKNLPKSLYFAIADYLKKGLYEGYGMTLKKAAGRDQVLLQELRENIYMFSGAKTYQQVVEMRDLVASASSYKEYKEGALKVYDQYNKTWLQTEYDTAIGQAQSAVKWTEFEKNKDILPNLRYSSIGDACKICKPLDGMIAPVDDPVWARLAPLNHFHCMCLLEATTEGAVSRDTRPTLELMDDNFKMNPGIDGYVFKESHPYFEVAKGDRGLAHLNFNLPIPEND